MRENDWDWPDGVQRAVITFYSFLNSFGKWQWPNTAFLCQHRDFPDFFPTFATFLARMSSYKPKKFIAGSPMHVVHSSSSSVCKLDCCRTLLVQFTTTGMPSHLATQNAGSCRGAKLYLVRTDHSLLVDSGALTHCLLISLSPVPSTPPTPNFSSPYI